MHRIVLNADIYKEVYKEQGYESRLLSRTTEDAATVTSVLIPWNTCGMTQSTVLGVPTFLQLPEPPDEHLFHFSLFVFHLESAFLAGAVCLGPVSTSDTAKRSWGMALICAAVSR